MFIFSDKDKKGKSKNGLKVENKSQNELKNKSKPEKSKIVQHEKNKYNDKLNFNLSSKDNKIYFCALGGIGKIGGNMYLYGYHGSWIIVDCGTSFPDETLPGVEILVPDAEFLYSIQDKILGLFLTHTHEDHYGAIPYIIPNLRKCPIYGTPFALGMVENKLRDSGIKLKHQLILKKIKPFANQKIKVGDFEIEYINVTHSIPEANMIALHFKEGSILHTGDFKFDDNPMIGEPTNMSALKNLSKKNMLAIVSDSTNSFEIEHSLSELKCRETVIKTVKSIKKGTIVLTCFSTAVAVMETAFLAAKESGINAVLCGRSMIRNYELAKKCGYLKNVNFLSQEEAAKKNGRKLYLITGTQGESRSIMTRVAADAFSGLKLKRGDTAIFSSSIVPGNEKEVFAVFNDLTKLGVDIISMSNNMHIHASGHASSLELGQLYTLIKPKSVIPMHGEIIHLKENANIANYCGIDNTAILDNGQVISITDDENNLEIVGNVPVGEIAIDGSMQVKTTNPIFKDRRKINYNGIVFVSTSFNLFKYELDSFDISLVGVGDVPQIDVLRSDIQTSIESIFSSFHKKDFKNKEKIKEKIQLEIKNVLHHYTDKKPQIVCHISIS